MNLKNLVIKFPVILSLLFFANGVQAQVSSDRSLSTKVTTEDNLNFTITEGDRAGNNLFHSFQEFSVPTNGSVMFNNIDTVENIINRVTGNFSSNIDGLIKANGTANVFLLNPNGIIFGENASLDIGGSFLATTAESFLFEGGIEFSSRDNIPSPLLSINVPLGVRIGNNSGTIVNRSQSQIPNPNPFGADNITVGLSVKPENNLALIGGDINFDGGVVTVTQGTIELGSAADNETVTFNVSNNNWNFDYRSVTQFGNIVLDNISLVTASGEGGGGINLQEGFVVPSGESGGEINIQGKAIRILNGSEISSDTFGSIDGKDITINASELVEIRGSDPTLQNIDFFVSQFGIFVPISSRVSTNTFAQGNGSNININTKDLFVFDGAKIELQTLNLTEDTSINFGDGGELFLEVEDSIVMQGVRPLIGVVDNIEEFILSGFEPEQAIEINQVSVITTASISNGLGGDIEISTGELIVEDGNIISSSPLSEGNGGDIIIEARERIKVSGISPRSGNTNSTIANTTFLNDGSAGNIEITTKDLILENGGAISTTTASQGSAGDITVNASLIIVDGIASDGQFPSGFNTATFSTGNAGDLVINTEELRVTNQAQISVQGSSTGIPGELTIFADSIELNNQGLITASTSAERGGNLNLNVKENILLRDNSQLSARAFENANGGNVMISAKFLIALPSENSDIVANAITGNGGNITITAEGIVGLEETEGSLEPNFSEINASSEFGESGFITIVTPDAETAEPERDVKIRVANLDQKSLDNFCRNLGKSSYIVTGRGGVPLLSEQIDYSITNWEDWRILEKTIQSKTTLQDENNKIDNLAAQEIDNYPQVAQGWVVNEQGQVILTTKPLMITPHPQQLTTPGC